MLSLKGYYNGKNFIPLEKAMIKPNQKVIITVLDEYLTPNQTEDKSYSKFVGKLSDESYLEIVEDLKETEKVDTNEW